MPEKTEITVSFRRIFRAFGDGDGENGQPRTIIASAKPVNGSSGIAPDAKAKKQLNQFNELTLKGRDDDCELLPGMEYCFEGYWDEHHKHGWQFAFQRFAKSEPHSRHGLQHYLRRYAPGVGPALSGRLFDKYGSDAVRVLRTEPHRAAAEVQGLTAKVAEQAAAALSEIAEFEETKIELVNLFAGRGFPHKLADQCVKEFGVLAPRRVKRDPFTLLVRGFSGCGFDRCDRLYLDLGNNPARLKRQMICAWHALRSDGSGNTWFPIRVAVNAIRNRVGGVGELRVERALKLGQRARWLRMRWDGKWSTDGKPIGEGNWWIAEGQKSWNEHVLAEKLAELMASFESLIPSGNGVAEA